MPKVDSPAIFVRCKSSANGFRAGVEVGSTVGWMAEMHRNSQSPFYGRPWSTGNDEFWMNFVVPVAPDPYSHTRLFFWTSVTANSTWISTRATKLYQSKESIKWWDDCGRMDKTIVIINNKSNPPLSWRSLHLPRQVRHALGSFTGIEQSSRRKLHVGSPRWGSKSHVTHKANNVWVYQ